MRIELDNYSKEVLERVEDELCTDYGRNGNYIAIEKLIAVIEDLEYEVHKLKESAEDRERDIEDNYKPIPARELYGVSESNFH